VARAVVAIAIELHGQPRVGPAAIDPAPAGGLVGHRPRKTRVSYELDEGALKLADRDRGVAVDDPAQPARTPTRGPAVERLAHLSRSGAVLDAGLVTSAREFLTG